MWIEIYYKARKRNCSNIASVFCMYDKKIAVVFVEGSGGNPVISRTEYENAAEYYSSAAYQKITRDYKIAGTVIK